MGLDLMGTNSIWTLIATIIIACVMLMGVGLLFVRASNIERRWLVAISTLVGSGFALYLMANDAQFVPGREMPTSVAAVVLSLLGFLIGRAIDVSLGERTQLRTELAD